MAGSFNSVTIVGYLGRDPDARYLPDGTPVTSFSVATTERYRTRDGQPQERTTWFRISAFGKLADTCTQFLHKGSHVYIQGPLAQQEYTDRDGVLRTSLEVRAREMHMLDKREDGETAALVGAVAGVMDGAPDMGTVPF